ncbi:alpha/beta fold hydrolase [Streptomyces sp. NPDC093225]|uniref:alpha/beta fold hydrolase n=1 Tax=Streptomyces sp. NPDC093225 TaxID=3366034 RepID=UPI0037F4899C
MAYVRVGGVGLHYVETGEGDPLVLVHGSWNDHRSWQAAIEADVRASFRVVAYDRRGHGESEAVPGQGTRRQDEDDLAGLIEGLGIAPAHVAGNSFGASIALGLAARRPELLRSLVAHEPPLVGVAADDPAAAAQLRSAGTAIEAVLEHLRRGHDTEGARLFVEEVAMGPGAWDALPEAVQDRFVRHAQTWRDEQEDPEWGALDLDALADCRVPVLLSGGTESPAWFAPLLDRLAAALPRARRHTFEGAGHIPHMTHPREYAELVTRFAGGA